MSRKVLTAMALAATAVAGVVPSAAVARHWDHGDWAGHDRPWHGGWRGHGWDDGGRYYYGGYGGYDGPRYYGRRYYRCDRGDGGTIIGAIAGGLLGNSIAGRGDRTAGTLIGAGVGALAGRAIDRDC